MISFSIYWLILPAVVVLFFVFGFDTKIREKNYTKKLNLLIERLGCRTVVHKTISGVRKIALNFDVRKGIASTFKFNSDLFKDFLQNPNLSTDKVFSDVLDLNVRDILSCNLDGKEITVSILFETYNHNPSITDVFFVKIPIKNSIRLDLSSAVKGFGGCKTKYPNFNSRFYLNQKDIIVPERIAEYCQNFEYGVSISTTENFLYFSSQMYPKDFEDFVRRGLGLAKIIDTL